MNDFEIKRLVEDAVRELREELEAMADDHDLARDLFEALARRMFELVV